jgi:16S rRNA (uracil1498-N3)-methyltransferase
MALPFFYEAALEPSASSLLLDEPTSKHVVQVLRMAQGEPLRLTDGRGNLFTAQIADANRKRCQVTVSAVLQIPKPLCNVTIAVSPVKNVARFEWLLEKTTEMGVQQIVPLLCERTEKQHLRMDRLQGILVSAMLQSQQCWLPQLTEPVKFAPFVAAVDAQQKFIAHCTDEAKFPLQQQAKGDTDRLILIGPEGDFTPAEIVLAQQHGFVPVALGNTRLRTETAAMVAAALLINSSI